VNNELSMDCINEGMEMTDKINKLKIGIIVLAIIPQLCFAHAGFARKDNLDEYSGRDYEEGTTGYFKLVVPHGCSNEDGSRTFETRHVVMAMPNGVDLSGIAYTEDRDGEAYGANAVMGVKPAADGDWRKIKNPKSAVPGYYSHGLKTEDVRSLRWIGGNIPNDFYKALEFRAKLPLLDACITELKVYFPTVQYCKSKTIKAWIREPVAGLPESVVSTGYAPSITVRRNLTSNPLPEACSDEGEMAEAYPDAEDIEAALLRPWQR